MASKKYAAAKTSFAQWPNRRKFLVNAEPSELFKRSTVNTIGKYQPTSMACCVLFSSHRSLNQDSVGKKNPESLGPLICQLPPAKQKVIVERGVPLQLVVFCFFISRQYKLQAADHITIRIGCYFKNESWGSIQIQLL